ncbi:MAG TPA: NAD-dependent epimerase/dehydratase family protein [Myxococcales bacterium]|jgi:UDP-glucose 4-epimerase|nr:NAD-dependent epimerase/dehydratase family protein [Myxococcales bacterium]
MAKVCVTGAAGFIGGHLAEELLRQGYEVTGLDDFSSGKRDTAALLSTYPRFQLVEGSIADPDAVARAVAGAKWVFHLAAIPSVPISINEPERTNAVNVGGTVNVMQAAVRAKSERVVFAASCAAYGDAPEQPKHERLPPHPVSPYAAQKVACELYAYMHTRAYGLPCVALRFFNVYGPRQDPRSEYAAAIPRFVTRLLSGQRPIVFGDGLQTRDFVHVSDVVRANLLAATAPAAAGEVVNVASGKSASLLELIALIKKAIGPAAAQIEPLHEAKRAGDVRASSADLTKARTVLGYEPRISLADGLLDVVEHWRGAIARGDEPLTQASTSREAPGGPRAAGTRSGDARR